jgi:hypothetical protein
MKISWTVGRSCGSPSAMSNRTDGAVRVSEGDLMKASTEVCWDKDLCFSFRISSYRGSIFVTLYLDVAARSNHCPRTPCSQPASVSPSPWVHFKPVVVVSFGSGSGSSASWRALCFRILTRFSSVISWSRLFSYSKTSLASDVRICASGLVYWFWKDQRRKSWDDCILKRIHYGNKL